MTVLQLLVVVISMLVTAQASAQSRPVPATLLERQIVEDIRRNLRASETNLLRLQKKQAETREHKKTNEEDALIHRFETGRPNLDLEYLHQQSVSRGHEGNRKIDLMKQRVDGLDRMLRMINAGNDFESALQSVGPGVATDISDVMHESEDFVGPGSSADSSSGHQRIVGPGSITDTGIIGKSCIAQNLIRRKRGSSIMTARELSSVAAILYDEPRHGSRRICSGTLIRPDVVITAAHCFCNTGAKLLNHRFYPNAAQCRSGVYFRNGVAVKATDPRGHEVYLDWGERRAARRIEINPRFRWLNGASAGDLALVFLDQPIFTVPPAALNELALLPPGKPAHVAGFGAHNPLGADGRPTTITEVVSNTGVKTHAPVRTDDCGPGAVRAGLICWDYLRGTGSSQNSSCFGDSGGPLFAEAYERAWLAGVISGGYPNCQPGASTFNTSIFRHRRWIRRTIDRYASRYLPKRLPDRVQARVCNYCQYCGIKNNPMSFTFSVPNPVDKLQFSISCSASTKDNRIELAARSPDNSIACSANRRGVFQTCSVNRPKAGTWHLSATPAATQDCVIKALTFQ